MHFSSSDSMSYPLGSNVNPELVGNLQEYRPTDWQESLELRMRSCASSIPGVIQTPETSAAENLKKKISDRVRHKMKREGKSETLPKERQNRKPPPVTVKEEDPEKVRIRRERNKIAATKCRRKRRERIHILKRKIEVLQSNKQKLTEEISSLRKKKVSLELASNNHWCVLRQGLPQLQNQASNSCTQTSTHPMHSQVFY